MPYAILSKVLFSVGLNTWTTASPASLSDFNMSLQALFIDSMMSRLDLIASDGSAVDATIIWNIEKNTVNKQYGMYLGLEEKQEETLQSGLV